MEYASGLSPLENLRIYKTPTPTLTVPARKLSWSADSSNSTPRRQAIARASSSRGISLSARGNLFRRMNSEPSPICKLLVDSGKENSLNAVPNPFVVPSSPSHSRAPLEDHDANSQDSGCSDDASNIIRFAIPSGLPPRKGIDPSPGKVWFADEPTSSPPGSFHLKPMRSLSFCSTDSLDDGFSELPELDLKNNDNTPKGLGSLLTRPLVTKQDNDSCNAAPCQLLPLRRAFSMVDDTDSTSKSAKRPGDLDECSGLLKKRKPCVPSKDLPSTRHKLQRSASENCATLLSSTLSSLYGRPELIADFSRPYALPVVAGKHSDLTSISAETLAAVLRDQYASIVNSYTIIDCRYPYEFEGGHIRGASNLYTFEQIEDRLLKTPQLKPNEECDLSSGRNIIIFHCEFSVARGPSMYRWLRRLDRNVSAYPALQYPEVYLLDGGYQTFYNSYPSLCEPKGYTPMQDPKHDADYRKFRSKTSSWSASRASFKRLQLL